jgi:succinate dehydrogenase / fumarate reductase flavoprotein subunit
MNDLVGIIRRRARSRGARAAGRLERGWPGRSSGGRRSTRLAPRPRPAEHAARLECIAMAALERTESRGGHTREDHPRWTRSGAGQPGLLGWTRRRR